MQKQYKKGQQYEKIVSNYVACSTSAAYIFNDKSCSDTIFVCSNRADSADTKSFVSSMCSKNGNYNNEKRRKKLKMAKTFAEKKFEEMRLWAIEHKLVDEFDKEILEILTVKMSDKDVDGMAALFGYFVLEHADDRYL